MHSVPMTACVLAAGLLVAACAQPGVVDRETAAEPTPVDIDVAAPTWGDGFDHVVVYATDDFAGIATDGTPVVPEPRSVDTAETVDSDGTRSVYRTNGNVDTVEFPPGALVVVEPERNELEVLADARLAGAVFSAVVVDTSETLQPVDARWALIDDRIVELGTPTADSTTNSSMTDPDRRSPSASSADELPAPGSFTGDSAAFIDMLADIDGVESATFVMPGVAAVALSGSRDVLDVDGVGAVVDDVLLDHADEPMQDLQWSLTNTGATSQAGGWPGVAGADASVPAAWTVSTGQGVVVAVVDSGVKLDHGDLAGRLWKNADENCSNGVDDDSNGRVDDCNGWDFGAGDNNPAPNSTSDSHGTHVAGIVAAGRNGVGIAGVAPDATVMPLKISSTAGTISGSSLTAAIVYAVDNGADIINLSLSTVPGTARSAAVTIENAVSYARNNGVVVVVAAGNNGVDLDSTPVWPANLSLFYDNVITVAASTNSDTRASFSNFGSPVSVFAPGWFLYSTTANGSWGFMSGTSMASPFVAGAAANVLASGAATTPSTIRARLQTTADTVSGFERVDVAQAVGVSTTPTSSIVVNDFDTVRAEQPATFSVVASGSGLANASTLRLSLAARVDNTVYAVQGLDATVTTPTETVSVTSANTGVLADLAISAPSALTSGWTASITSQLPAGEYALIGEILTSSGERLGAADVTYLSVGNSGSTTTIPGNPPIAPPPAVTLPTTPPSGGGPGGGDGPVPTQPPTGATIPGGGMPPITIRPPVTGTPPTSGTPPTRVPGGSGQPPAVTQPPSAPTTMPVPTGTMPEPTGTDPPSTPPPPTTVPSAAPPATVPVPGGPGSPPVTTTPPPAPDIDGAYSVTAMTPRAATTAGNTKVVLTGVFPTAVPIYVWFGTAGIAGGRSADGTTLRVDTPAVLPVSSPTVVDVVVKFRTTRSFELTLGDAFTFTTGADPTTPTTVPGPGGSSGEGSGDSGVGGSTPPVTTSPPVSTVPSLPLPTAPATPGAPPQPVRSLGSLQLHRPPSGSVMASLSVAAWPSTGCNTTAC